jgi:hypothetical protein
MTDNGSGPSLETCQQAAQNNADATGRIWYVIRSGKRRYVRDSEQVVFGRGKPVLLWAAFPVNKVAP